MEPLQNDDFDYIYNYVSENFPSVEYDPETEETTKYLDLRKAMIFENRYYSNKLNVNFKYEDYLNNKEIQKTVDALGIDKVKFWNLILFIFDYSYCACLEGYKAKETHNNQVKKTLNTINEKEVTKITLNIKGKHNLVIDDPKVLEYISSLLAEGVENNSIDKKGNDEHNVSLIDLTEQSAVSNSAHIAYFAKMFVTFFENNPQFKGRQKKGEIISYNKLLLISKIIYFTRLSRNKNFDESEDTLKGFLKQYKDYKGNFNLIYG